MPQSFTDFMVETDYADIPEDVRKVMRRSLMDTIGVAVIGATTEISGIVRRYADEFWNAPDDKPRARMIMDGRRVSPAGAAFAGAFTIDSIDAHDGFSPAKGHAGSAVFPALLAVMEERSGAGQAMSAQDFMLAMVLAYEVG
jgi:2-methylcitrate dehydratase PrpD